MSSWLFETISECIRDGFGESVVISKDGKVNIKTTKEILTNIKPKIEEIENGRPKE